MIYAFFIGFFAGSGWAVGQIIVRMYVWKHLFHIAAIFNFPKNQHQQDMRNAAEFRKMHEVAARS